MRPANLDEQHSPAGPAPAGPRSTEHAICNATFPSVGPGRIGRPLTPGDGCYGTYTRSDGTKYPTTSKFTQADLQTYGYRPRGLTDAQYDALRSRPRPGHLQHRYQHQRDPDSLVHRRHHVAGALLGQPGASRSSAQRLPRLLPARTSTAAAACASNSVTIVVRAGARPELPGRQHLAVPVGAIFVPDGKITGQRGHNTIGTVFAKTIDLGGNPDYYMDQCFASNPPGATLDARC